MKNFRKFRREEIFVKKNLSSSLITDVTRPNSNKPQRGYKRVLINLICLLFI